MIHLIFSGEPRAVQSCRFTRKGIKYQPKEVVEWKNWVKLQALQELPGFKPLQGPVSVSIRYVFAPLKSFNKTLKNAIETGETIYKITKPDLTDNLNKGFIDALSGIIWEKDQVICKGDNEKVYGKIAHTELWAMELKGLYR